MGELINLVVYRALENRNLDLSDDSPLAMELHQKRGRALHDVLEPSSTWVVTDWGNTDDAKAFQRTPQAAPLKAKRYRA